MYSLEILLGFGIYNAERTNIKILVRLDYDPNEGGKGLHFNAYERAGNNDRKLAVLFQAGPSRRKNPSVEYEALVRKLKEGKYNGNIIYNAWREGREPGVW